MSPQASTSYARLLVVANVFCSSERAMSKLMIYQQEVRSATSRGRVLAAKLAQERGNCARKTYSGVVRTRILRRPSRDTTRTLRIFRSGS